MTREPLMLSDTAMVLLREYHELETSHCAYRAEKQRLEKLNRRLPEWEVLYPAYSYNSMSVVRWQLMQEIWLLWTFSDIPVIRHLEWHLVFNAALMMMAEKTFIPSHEYPRGNIRFMTRTPSETGWFLETLDMAYTKALRLRAQTKMTP